MPAEPQAQKRPAATSAAVGGNPSKRPRADPMPPAVPEWCKAPFPEALTRTIEALREISAVWKEKAAEQGNSSAGAEAVANALRTVCEDSSKLTEEGWAWSQQTGAAYVLPQGALGSRPLLASDGRDGLIISTAGGPVEPTDPGVIVAPAPPCGHGLFAAKALAKGTSLGEYLGEARSYDVWVKEIKDLKRQRRNSDEAAPFIPEELYAAWTGNGPAGAGVVLDAFFAGNSMRFANCSCLPNSKFHEFGRGSQGHYRVKVVTKRDIQRGEQISVNYGWYYDPETLDEVRRQAAIAYTSDLPVLQKIAKRLQTRSTNGSPEAVETKEVSDAILAVEAALASTCDTAAEQPGGTEGPREMEISFLRRFLDPQKLKAWLEDTPKVLACEAVEDFMQIPDPVWFLYEVVGASVVGISCRCGLDPSLNPKRQCSGIIGRPLQVSCDGRQRDLAAEVEWPA